MARILLFTNAFLFISTMLLTVANLSLDTIACPKPSLESTGMSIQPNKATQYQFGIQNSDENSPQGGKGHQLPDRKGCGLSKAVNLGRKPLGQNVNAKPSKGFKYQLEMPALTLPSMRSTEKRSNNPTIKLPGAQAESSSITTLKNKINPTDSSLPVPRFSKPCHDKMFPILSKKSKVSIDTKTPTQPLKKTALANKQDDPSRIQKKLEIPKNQKAFSNSIPTLIPGIAPPSGHMGESAQLPIGSSSNKNSTQFQFKVPKHPIGANSFSKASTNETSLTIHPQSVTKEARTTALPATSVHSTITDTQCPDTTSLTSLQAASMECSNSPEYMGQTSFSSSTHQLSQNQIQTSKSSDVFQAPNNALQDTKNREDADVGKSYTEFRYSEAQELAKIVADESDSHSYITSQSHDLSQIDNQPCIIESNSQEVNMFQPQSDFGGQQGFPPQDFGSHSTMVTI